MIEAVSGICHSAMVMPSTQSGSTLPNSYDLMSPLLSSEEDELIHQTVNDVTCSYSSNGNLPPMRNTNNYSATDAAVPMPQIFIQDQHLQPCNQFQQIFSTPFQVVQI